MTAEIVSVGTELLLGQIADTNAQRLGQLLPELGIDHKYRQTVGDNVERLTEALKLALSRADIVFTIGGLGPTEDDLTRDGIAAALGETLELDEKIAEKLRKMFALRNLPWVESQTRQAMVPSCGKPIDNPNGSAPGLICEKDGKIVIAMPGPHGEFVPMLDGPIREFLAGLTGRGEPIHSRVLRICGMGESVVEDKIRPLLASQNPSIAPYAHPGEVHLRLTARAPSMLDAEGLLSPVEAQIREALGDCVYGTDETTLEAAVVGLLKDLDATVAVAESITGGGLGERFTNVSGSGDVFLGGIISYDLDVKKKLLGVDPALLEDESRGPITAECALQMARGARKALSSDYAISTTGNAGPTTDKGDKPVGLTYIAVVWEGGEEVEEHHFRGTREFIRTRAEQAALTMMRRILLR